MESLVSQELGSYRLNNFEKAVIFFFLTEKEK